MKKRKIFKTLAFSSLAACMFCLPVLAGCAPAEMLPEKPTQGQNFDLGLNPATDPIVYTTASGLQIKKSDGKYSSTINDQDLIGYYYFTMGTYSGHNVNWIILGRGQMAIADNTPAGSAIQLDNQKQEIAIGNSIYESLNLNTMRLNSEIPNNCFLVLSECCLGTSLFNPTGYGNRYTYASDRSITRGTATYAHTYNNKTPGTLYTKMKQLYETELNLSAEYKKLIQPQQIRYFYQTTDWMLNSSETIEHYLFPLAYSGNTNQGNETFCTNNYLPGGVQANSPHRIAFQIGTTTPISWWVTTGHTNGAYGKSICYSTTGGGLGIDGDTACGVRPAMVIKLS